MTTAMKRDQRKQKLGRGQGTGKEYTPYLAVQESGSYGEPHRIKGITTGRLHHLMSKLESDVFRLYDWSERITDIREQFPLDQTETLLIAERLGIKHPIHPKTRQPIVMTTDLMLTVTQQDSLNLCDYVRTVKPIGKICQKRVLEKFEIERVYFQSRGIDWGIVTDLDVPKDVVRNLAMLRPYNWLHQFLIPDAQQSEIRDRLNAALRPDGIMLNRVALGIDDELGLKQKTSLSVAYNLIVTRRWHIDLTKRIKANQIMLITNMMGD